MQKDIKQLIEARETEEATYSRYEKTINRHRYSNIDNLRLSVFDMVLKYLDECDEEDKNEKEISSDERRKKNFFEKFFQLQGIFPDDDDDI